MEFIEHFYDSVCDRSCSHIDSSPLLIESIRESTIQMINLQSIKSPALNQFKKNIRIFHKNRMQFFVMRNKWGQQTCNVSPPSVNDFVLVLEFDPSVSSEQNKNFTHRSTWESINLRSDVNELAHQLRVAFNYCFDIHRFHVISLAVFKR